MATQQAEERFMQAKGDMQNSIAEFYGSCEPADIDDAGFMEDINDAVRDVTGHEFEPWTN